MTHTATAHSGPAPSGADRTRPADCGSAHHGAENSGRRFFAALLLGSLLLTGCGAATSSSSPAGAPAQDQRAGTTGEAGAAPAGAKVPAATANAPQTAPGGAPVTDNRLLARTAAITLQVPDVAAAVARLRVIAAGKGGIVSAENLVVSQTGVGRPSTLVIVVPAERLDATLDDIGAVGKLVLRTVNTTDVTTQVADVDARVRTQRESIARIQELLKQAGSVAEIAQVEGELTRRQAELESLLARQKALSGMVAESPITVTLVTPAMPDAEPTPEPPGFLLGLKTGWVMFTGLVGVTLMVIGGLLPFALFFGAVGTAIWFVAKRVAARRRASRPDPTWPTPPPSAAPRPPDSPSGTPSGTGAADSA